MSPLSDSLSLRLPYSVKLATERKSLTHYTKGTQSPRKEAPTVCMHTVSGLFTPLPGFFSPFPHGTSSLSVDHEYLALEDGPPMFRQGFTCPALLVASSVPPPGFRVRGYHPLWRYFPEASTNATVISCRLFPFRSPLLWESRLISFPPGTKMFQFSGFASADLCIQSGMTLAGRVSPFGHLRVKACLPARRNFSQTATSFIACDRQGIHHMHLVT